MSGKGKKKRDDDMELVALEKEEKGGKRGKKAAAAPAAPEKEEKGEKRGKKAAAPAAPEKEEKGGKRGQKVAAAPAAQTPFQQWEHRLQAVLDANGATNYSLTRGAYEDDDDDDGEDRQPTKEEMDRVAVVLLTPKRLEAVQNADEMVLGEQAGDDLLMFNTAFSYEVCDLLQDLPRQFARTKSWPDRFDFLFGITQALKRFDTWIHDHETGWGGEELIEGLAKLWKKTLANSDQVLGIDSEFSRPGVIALLSSFADLLEQANEYMDEPIRFRFQ